MTLQYDFYFTSFKQPIIGITSINKYIFFEVKGNELNILKYENENSIVYVNKIYLTTSEVFTTNCLIWCKTNNDIIRYNIAYTTDDSSIGVIQYFDYMFVPYTQGNQKILSSISSFQNFFYDFQLDSLFIVERQGKRIEEVMDYGTTNYKIIRKYFRGSKSEYITDIRSLRKDYVAMASSGKSILIFFYGDQDISVASLMIGIINQGILSCIKINLKELNPLDSYEQCDLPQKKNEMKLLFNNSKGNELNCYNSNGIYYCFKIDYIKNIHSLINKSIFWSQKHE